MAIILLIAAAFIIYILQDKLYRHYWSKNLTASIAFQDTPVLEGESATLTEVITNKKILPLPVLHAKFQVSRYLEFHSKENTSLSDSYYKNDIFSILFYQKITRTLKFTCTKRGYYRISQVDLVTSGPLMTHNHAITCPQDTWLYVYPRPINIDSLDVPFKKLIGSLTSRQFMYEDPFEFRGIRAYTHSDPMSAINWNASARNNTLMVNVHHSTISQEAVLLLNLEDETIWKYDALHEAAIQIAAALSERFLRNSIPTRIICNGKDIVTGQIFSLPAGSGLRQINAIQECLARIDLNKAPSPFLPLVTAELNAASMRQPLYIMIGNCMRSDLQTAFLNLSAHASGLLWVLPLHKDMECKISTQEKMDVVRYEVSK